MIPRPSAFLRDHWYVVDMDEFERRPDDRDRETLHGGRFWALRVDVGASIVGGWNGWGALAIEVPRGRVWILEQVRALFYHATGWVGTKQLRIDKLQPYTTIDPQTKVWGTSQGSFQYYASDLVTSTSRSAAFHLWRNRPTLLADPSGNIGFDDYPRILHPIWEGETVMAIGFNENQATHDITTLQAVLLIQDVPVGSKYLEQIREDGPADLEALRKIAAVGATGAIDMVSS